MIDFAERLEAAVGDGSHRAWPVWANAASGATPVSQWNNVLLPDP